MRRSVPAGPVPVTPTGAVPAGPAPAGAAAWVEREISHFSALQKDLPGSAVPWLEEWRCRARDRFAQAGLPTPEEESWRFTRLEPLWEKNFDWKASAAVPAARPSQGLLGGIDAYRLVFRNGRYCPQSSSLLPAPARAQSLARLLEEEPALVRPYLAAPAVDEAFASLNAAFFNDGAFVHLPEGVLDKPLHLLFLSDCGSGSVQWHGRVLVVLGPSAQGSIIEEFAGPSESSYFTNMVTDVHLAPGAGLTRLKLQTEGRQAFHFATLRVRQESDSRFSDHSLSWGAGLARNDVSVSLEGAGAEVSLNGLYFANGRQHVDSHTVIEHKAPHGTSRELYKGVLDGAGRAVFNGAIEVRPSASKTNARVYNKNLLLSDKSVVNTKPDFKIYANDVQCRHGATVGQMDADALFYLRSRGLSEKEARDLLVYAFASEMIEKIPWPDVREALAAIYGRLPGETNHA